MNRFTAILQSLWCRLHVSTTCTLGIAGLLAGASAAQDFSRVPGEVISYLESPERNSNGTVPDPSRVYLSSPSLTIAANGDYFVSHDLFGDGAPQNQSKVFRSTDRGITWTEQATINDAFASTLFFNPSDGALYLWGYREYHTNGNADVLIRKSMDNGVTWTTPTNSSNGLLLDTNLYGQSNTPTVYNGRLWIALAGKRVMSAPVGSNLLLASSWIASDSANTNGAPWGSNLSITEAQVVASPQHGVAVLPKVDGYPNAIVIRATSDPAHVVNIPAAADYIDLPGGEKKFAAQYDPVSSKYYIVSNPVLPAHADDPEIGDHPELIRNTAALLSSKDLRNWDVEQIFLYTPNIDRSLGPGLGMFGEAFQYMNFVVDGDDLAIVSRTAFDIDGDASQAGANLPPKGHDSNLITFHRIEDFRTAAPTHTLALATGSRVVRRESTQHMDAPLGNFHLGNSFDGAPLNQPNGIAQDTNGEVYIREQGGRILRFDALGNFIATAATLPNELSFTSGPLEISQPAEGERSWVRGNAGTWEELTNWYYWGRPDTNSEIGTLGSAVSSDTTITMSKNYTFKGLRFRSSNSYLIDGPGEITIEADSGNGVLDVQQGVHRIANPVTLYSDADLMVAAGARLFFKDTLNLSGKTLRITGQGQRNIDGTFLMLGGTLVTDGRNQVSFSSTTTANLNGTLEFAPYDGASVALGATHLLFNGITNVTSTFTNVKMPVLVGTLGWNTTDLYVNGSVTVIDVPNPTWNKNSNSNWEDSGNWVDHGVPNSKQEVADFADVITANRTVAMNSNYSLKGLRFRDSSHSYLINGAGAITIDADTGNGIIEVVAGNHQILNPLTLASNTDWIVASGGRLLFKDALHLNGMVLSASGAGNRNIDQAFTMNGGTLETDGQSPITFTAASNTTLNGTLRLAIAEDVQLVPGTNFDLINGNEFLDGVFNEVELPVLRGGLEWDTSLLYATGVVSVGGLTGDYNFDGRVDAADYTVWRDSLGSPLAQADGNRNGIVDEADYAVWRDNFGGSNGGGNAGSIVVPEPSTLMLIAVGATMLPLNWLYPRGFVASNE
jgi:hypothetical protein